MEILSEIDQIVERSRWKEEGWERPKSIERLEELSSRNSGNMLVHFSDLGDHTRGSFKLGVNPESKDIATPKGVYGYPLNSWFIDAVKNDKIPYASRRKWLYVIEAKGNVIRINPNGSVRGYDETDMSRDIEHIWSKYKDDGGIRAWFSDIDEMFTKSEINARNRQPFGRLWFVLATASQATSQRPSVRWNKLLRELGIDCVIDDGSETIHTMEPRQGVIVDPTKLEVLDILKNPEIIKREREERRQDASDRGFDIGQDN